MRRRFNRRLDMETRFERARRRNMVDARPGIHECIVILDGLKPDFNIGKIFRTADAFSVREIHLVGVGIFDPEPAKGSVRWVQYVLHDDFTSCHDQLRSQGYTFFALEPGGTEVLGKGGLPEKSAFIFGHEEFGLSFNPDDYTDIHPLTIPQWGHVQSLNVSVAASVVLYEYVRQHGRPLSEGLVQHPGGDTRRGGKNG